MDFGPNSLDVTAYIASIPTLTEAELDEGTRAMVKYRVNLSKELDEASMEVTLALLHNPFLDTALTAAKVPTLSAVQALPWLGSNKASVREFVMDALGAIVVLDSIRFESVIVRFRPFRFSSVDLPVQWGDSMLS